MRILSDDLTHYLTAISSFTEFATFLLHNPSFDWTISTSKLRVTALGTIFDNISLSKVITLKAFNGIPGVIINNFQLPSDDPAGGIHIETGANIPSTARELALSILPPSTHDLELQQRLELISELLHSNRSFRDLLSVVSTPLRIWRSTINDSKLFSPFGAQFIARGQL